MKANPDKCHFICNTVILMIQLTWLIAENQTIDNSKCEKLLASWCEVWS